MIEPESSSGIVAETWPSTRSRIGRREDLLGRDVREVATTVDRRRGRAARPVRRRKQADREVGARAVEAERVEAALGEARRVRLQRRSSARATPRPGRRVEAADVRDVLPELLVAPSSRVEVGVDELGPRGSGRARCSSSSSCGSRPRRSRGGTAGGRARRAPGRGRRARAARAGRRARCARRARPRGRAGARASTAARSRACPRRRARCARA